MQNKKTKKGVRHDEKFNYELYKKTTKGGRHDEKFNHELYKRITEIKNTKNGQNTNKNSSNV
jgi:hypothetical protein